jgi:hypothetical protein
MVNLQPVELLDERLLATLVLQLTAAAVAGPAA